VNKTGTQHLLRHGSHHTGHVVVNSFTSSAEPWRVHAVLWCAVAQAAALWGRLETCVRLVEAGSPWPTGKGAKSGGGDVVTLLANSKLCKQRQLKVCRQGVGR
jgi:hypothetical protein